MKFYDVKKIQDYIAAHESEINEVAVGMKEDWMWTAVTVYTDGEYTDEFIRGFSVDANRVELAGIYGSWWATPVMLVQFKDGKKVDFPCYVDDGKEMSEKDVRMMKCFVEIIGGMDELEV